MIHRSRFADVPIPDLTIAEMVFAGLKGREDQPALIDGLTGRMMTGAELIDASRRFAGGAGGARHRAGAGGGTDGAQLPGIRGGVLWYRACRGDASPPSTRPTPRTNCATS